MDTLQALILGILQGLTEYLPVSSSGHLTIGAALFGINGEENLMFTIMVHVATVLSTLVVLGGQIVKLIRGCFTCGSKACPVGTTQAAGEDTKKCGLNPDQRYVLGIIISMIPIGIVGVFFKDKVEEIFGSGLTVVGICLILTAALLTFSYFAKPRQKEYISLRDAFIIGLSQAVAVFPGLSRSGTTIATGLLLGNKKAEMAQFSFLMVIPPILGEALLDTVKAMKDGFDVAFAGLSPMVLITGFLAAFISGVIACKWMIRIVQKGKLIYFAYYCVLAGVLTLIFG